MKTELNIEVWRVAVGGVVDVLVMICLMFQILLTLLATSPFPTYTTPGATMDILIVPRLEVSNKQTIQQRNISEFIEQSVSLSDIS